jgi:hypothetical protein
MLFVVIHHTKRRVGGGTMIHREIDLLEWVLDWAPQVEFFAMAPVLHVHENYRVTFSSPQFRTYTEVSDPPPEAIVAGGISQDFFEKFVLPTLNVEYAWCSFQYLHDAEVLFLIVATVGYCYQEILNLAGRLNLRVLTGHHGRIIPEDRWEG